MASAGWLFADRVDLPFITEAGAAQARISGRSFGERNWDPDFASWRVLADFAPSRWESRINLPEPHHFINQIYPEAKNPGAQLEAELKDLETMALDERPDALGEIVAQAGEFISYFMTVLGGKPSTHRASCLVFNSANLVATMVTMHFKGKRNRPRPSHVFPGLLPPIEVPGHASYPSGHATQAFLFARCAKEMLKPAQPEGQQPAQPEGQQPAPPKGQQEKQPEMWESMGVVLDALAHRIARNREIAGLHYPSDTAAGRHLAGEIYNVLAELETFKAAMKLARSEWQDDSAADRSSRTIDELS
jgi:hypothetical protein